MRVLALSIALVGLQLHASAQLLQPEVSLMTGQPLGKLAVAGRLVVDLHARFMVSRSYGSETVLNWYNCGYAGGGKASVVGGNFGDFGLHVPHSQRDEKYPHAVVVDHVTEGVRFDGGDAMRANFGADEKIAAKEDFAVEVWLHAPNESANQVILGWSATVDGSAPSLVLGCPEVIAGKKGWHHLVLNAGKTKQALYVDGVLWKEAARKLEIGQGHHLVLGGGGLSKPSFCGDLAAVRVHDEAMSLQEIQHNAQGGVLLGTELHSWWNLEKKDWWSQESEHFRHTVEHSVMRDWDSERRAEFESGLTLMFQQAELVYRTYTERMALRSSVVSRRPEKRGDGIKYKTPIQATGGEAVMGCDDDFGWGCQLAGTFSAHELVHGFQAQTGSMIGHYWETHANFPQTYNGFYESMPFIVAEGAFVPSGGRTYYHDRSFFEHLAQTPEYGPMFISKLWYDGPTATEAHPYPFETFTRLDPDPTTPLALEYARMVQRLVTYDFQTFAEAPAGSGNNPFGNDGVPSEENRYRRTLADAEAVRTDMERRGRVVLQAMPETPGWWRVSRHEAPLQMGWNLCLLDFKAGEVSCELQGYANAERKPQWRVSFVAVMKDGSPVYGPIFGSGEKSSFEVPSQAVELFLTVCAVPDLILPVGHLSDFRSFSLEPFPYKVRLAGCTPRAFVPETFPEAAGAPHRYGGGFVAKTAKVDPSVYVAPNARVLGYSILTGRARVEDHATVMDSTLTDEAIVGGYALVTEKSTVRGHARVLDYAVVKAGSTVSENARLLEHGQLMSGKECGGHVTIKGHAVAYGGQQSGFGVLDGYYAKANDITQGTWFMWSWGVGRAEGEMDVDFGSTYLRMDFDNPHSWMARDDHAATWGYLHGSPEIVKVDGATSQKWLLKEPPDVLTFYEGQITASPATAYVQGCVIPPCTGEFVIRAESAQKVRLFIAGTSFGKTLTEVPSEIKVHLEKGKAYPLCVLHENPEGTGSFRVIWQRPDMEKGHFLVMGDSELVNHAGSIKKGAIRYIWPDTASAERHLHAEKAPVLRESVPGSALKLDGQSQFVELPADTSLFRDITIRCRFKTGSEKLQTLYEFANSKGDHLALRFDKVGGCVFDIQKGNERQILQGPAVRSNEWTEVTVALHQDAGALLINGQLVAKNLQLTLNPEDLRANRCYLGRSINGQHFQGLIDSFEIKSAARPEDWR
jgi:hypothetical protein